MYGSELYFERFDWNRKIDNGSPFFHADISNYVGFLTRFYEDLV